MTYLPAARPEPGRRGSKAIASAGEGATEKAGASGGEGTLGMASSGGSVSSKFMGVGRRMISLSSGNRWQKCNFLHHKRAFASLYESCSFRLSLRATKLLLCKSLRCQRTIEPPVLLDRDPKMQLWLDHDKKNPEDSLERLHLIKP